VFQDTTLDSYLTGEQNLRFHADLYGVPKAAFGPRLRQVLEMVGLWERRDSVVATYSGGMLHRQGPGADQHGRRPGGDPRAG
jgi:ABC-2 type transport system ATP-binding protein